MKSFKYNLGKRTGKLVENYNSNTQEQNELDSNSQQSGNLTESVIRNRIEFYLP